MFQHNSDLGDKLEAGLPNITGTYPFGADGYNYPSNPSGSGAIYFEGRWTDTSHRSSWGNTQEHSWVNAKLDASRSSNIYGKSSTVQPPALCVIFWKRTI